MIRDSQAGFTLAELLVTVTVLTVISGAITQAMFVGLRTTEATNRRLSESADGQLAAMYLTADVQSTSFVDTTSTSSPASPSARCGAVGNGTTQILKLEWTDGDGQIVTYAYRADPESTGPARPVQLLRRHCTVTALGPGVDLDQILARSLSPRTAPAASCNSPCSVVTLTLTEQVRVEPFLITASTRTGT